MRKFPVCITAAAVITAAAAVTQIRPRNNSRPPSSFELANEGLSILLASTALLHFLLNGFKFTILVANT